MTDNDNKPPALPAMMIVEILREIADGEQLITERVRKKHEIEALLKRDDIRAVLEIEAEVAQEVFLFAVSSLKKTALHIVATAFKAQGRKADTRLLKKIEARIASIKMTNPYTKGDE